MIKIKIIHSFIIQLALKIYHGYSVLLLFYHTPCHLLSSCSSLGGGAVYKRKVQIIRKYLKNKCDLAPTQSLHRGLPFCFCRNFSLLLTHALKTINFKYMYMLYVYMYDSHTYVCSEYLSWLTHFSLKFHFVSKTWLCQT